MTTEQMLEKLRTSKNEPVALQASQILDGKLMAENVKRYCGSFLRAVLDGNYEDAIWHADDDNYEALTGHKPNYNLPQRFA